MISLPPQLTPSELLHHQGTPRYIHELLRSSRSLRREGRLPEARRCALGAVEAGQRTSSRAVRGLALVHLADVHREMGRLRPALVACQEGYRIFRCQPSRYQRHNQALAAYALGLVHQLLGSESDSLRWYQESSELFDKAKDDWAAANALSQVESCVRVSQWMEMLSSYVTAIQTRKEVSFSARVWTPVILPDKDRLLVERLQIDEYVEGRGLTASIKLFHVHPLEKGWHISLTPDVEYDAQEIPAELRQPLGAGDGDHALVQWTDGADRVNSGKLERLGESEVGTFVRGADERVFVIRRGPEVIGGGRRMGHVTALLKPT